MTPAPGSPPAAAASAAASALPGGTRSVAIVTGLSCPSAQNLRHMLTTRFVGVRGDANVVGCGLPLALLLELSELPLVAGDLVLAVDPHLAFGSWSWRDPFAVSRGTRDWRVRGRKGRKAVGMRLEGINQDRALWLTGFP